MVHIAISAGMKVEIRRVEGEFEAYLIGPDGVATATVRIDLATAQAILIEAKRTAK